MQVNRLKKSLLFCLSLLVTSLLFLPSAKAWQTDADDLIQQLRSGAEAERSAAADKLGFMPAASGKSVPVLIEQLSGPSQLVRWRSARALGNLGVAANQAAGAMCKSIDGADATLQTQIAIALGRIGDNSDETVNTLMGLVANENPSVARRAIASLRMLDVEAKTVVDAFAKVLERDEHAIVIHAVEAMIERGGEAVPILNEILKNDRTAIWGCIAIESIGAEASDTVPALMELIGRTKDSRTRINALLSIAAIGEAAQSTGPRVAEMYGELSNNTEQAAAIYALGSVGFQNAEEQLSHAASSDNDLLAAIGAWGGAKLHPNDDEKVNLAVIRLTQALRSEDVQLRTAAARALADLNLPSEKVAPALIAVANDPDPSVVANVVDALASRGAAVAPKAGKALADPNLKHVALAVIGRLGINAREAIPDMVSALDGEKGSFRADLQLALAVFGSDSAAAVPQLIQSLDSSDEKVRSSAMYTLGRIGSSAATAGPKLEQEYGAATGFDKLAACWALVNIFPDNPKYRSDAAKHLPEGLKNSDAGIRLECVRTLGTLGASAKSALPELKAVSQGDRDKEVREAAAEAVKQIEGDG